MKVSQLNVEYVTPGETSEICVYDMGDWRYGTYRCDYYGGAWNTLTYVDMSFVVGFGNDEQMYRVTNWYQFDLPVYVPDSDKLVVRNNRSSSTTGQKLEVYNNAPDRFKRYVDPDLGVMYRFDNEDPDFGGGSIQDYAFAPTFSLIRLSPEYFCTPLEAEQAGYSASPHQYEFPHLKAQDKN